MKAWQIDEWGEPDQMRLREVPAPIPGAGEILIRNKAAALNFFDILLIQGKYQVKPPLPLTPGAEVSGYVESIGDGVTGFEVGDRVNAMAASGAYSEYSLASAAKTFRIPDRMSFEEAAGMTVTYQTSWFALNHRTRLTEGEWLLVHAAAGGVGIAALQIGKALGAQVIAAVGSEEKFPFCLGQGADHAITYSDTGWVDHVRKITGGHGADVIYDPVGGDVFDLSTKCLAPEGRLLIIGFAGGRIPTVAANRVLLKNYTIMGVYWGGYVERNPRFMAETQEALFGMYEEHKIRPVFSKTYKLQDAPTAMKDLAGRRVQGKAILVI
jgi:NADPH2:quinone reductase